MTDSTRPTDKVETKKRSGTADPQRRAKAQAQAKTIARLRREIEELKGERADLTDKLLRTAAAFDNYKKRIERDYSEYTLRINADLVRELLPVLDDFDRSLEVAAKTTTYQKFREGVELIAKKLNGILRERGLQPIDAVGQAFDPEQHEALMQMESKEHPANINIAEQSKGYTFQGKVIRHAKVIVSK